MRALGSVLRLHFLLIFLFAELLPSVPTFLELTCEFLSLTLTEIQPVVTFHFLVNRLRKHFITQTPQKLLVLSERNSVYSAHLVFIQPEFYNLIKGAFVSITQTRSLEAVFVSLYFLHIESSLIPM